ncbi:MAG: transporter substrate-binding protein [Pseudomonadota bacterium]|nr:transporter substrate-binding protein [Pseudomonadota bacterium]
MIKKIGLLFSLSGTIAVVGEGQLQAALLAIEEINQSSILQFEPITRDTKSDPVIAAKEAHDLTKEVGVDVLIGCYMSSERNALIPVLNQTGSLLIYPTLYEGEQLHPNIFYLGAVPNQQVEPLLSWAITNLSYNFVLVGSDYIYPRSTNSQVRQFLENVGGKILAEYYFPLGCEKFDYFFSDLNEMVHTQPGFVLFSTIVGTSVAHFYQEYKKNNIPFPILSPITSEREIRIMGIDAAQGHISTSPYFESIESEKNQKFVKMFTTKFGDQPISREMVSTYEAIHLLSLAYSKISSVPYSKEQKERVKIALKNTSFNGPRGKIIVDPTTQHLWQWSRIGKVNSKGELKSIWSSPGPIPPRHYLARVDQIIVSESRLNNPDPVVSLVGVDKIFLKGLNVARIAANTPASVLITGDTGTGKELVARFIHDASTRRNNSFIPISCSSIPGELLGSELFGYEEGAFTGAKRGGKIGFFEMANGGTLFLDEIGEMPIGQQPQLLRVVEEKKIYKLGGHKQISVDVRIIAASNKNLFTELGNLGSFRRDLYYRISVFHIELPRLCERGDDILILAGHFLALLNATNRKDKVLSKEVENILMMHNWPGNIRELSNAIEYAFYLSLDNIKILPDHLPQHVFSNIVNINNNCLVDERNHKTSIINNNFCDTKSNANPCERNAYFARITHNMKIKNMEEKAIRQSLDLTGFNISKSAFLLGMGRNTLYRRLKKYNLLPPLKS